MEGRVQPEQIGAFSRHVADATAETTGRYLELLRALFPNGQPVDLNDQAIEGIRRLSRALCLRMIELSRRISAHGPMFDVHAPRMRDPRVVQPLVQALGESYFLLTQLTGPDDLDEIARAEEVHAYLDGDIRRWLEMNTGKDHPALGPAA